MKEPKRIPLTDSVRKLEPKRIPLTTQQFYDLDFEHDTVWSNNENNQTNNSESIQQLESNETN